LKISQCMTEREKNREIIRHHYLLTLTPLDNSKERFIKITILNIETYKMESERMCRSFLTLRHMKLGSLKIKWVRLINESLKHSFIHSFFHNSCSLFCLVCILSTLSEISQHGELRERPRACESRECVNLIKVVSALHKPILTLLEVLVYACHIHRLLDAQPLLALLVEKG